MDGNISFTAPDEVQPNFKVTEAQFGGGMISAFVKRLTGGAKRRYPDFKPGPASPNFGDVEGLKSFVADAIIRPAARGKIDVSDLVPDSADRFAEFLSSEAAVFGHPDGGWYLAKEPGSANLLVISQGHRLGPNDLSDDKISEFLPAGSTITKLERSQGEIKLQGTFSASLTGDAQEGRFVVTLGDFTPDWIFWISIIRGFPDDGDTP